MSDWYVQLEKSDESVEQGDVLSSFPIVQADLGVSDIQDVLNHVPIQLNAATLLTDVVVMSQSCDLANKKVTSIVLAPVVASDLFLSQIHPSGKRKSVEASIRKRQVGYIYPLPADPSLGLPERFVDFRVLYTTSLETIAAYLQVRATERIRLKDSPKASIAQHFGLFFSRVAEPDPPRS